MLSTAYLNISVVSGTDQDRDQWWNFGFHKKAGNFLNN